MYKNKEKQRATERERQRRHRKGVTEGVTELKFSKSRQAQGRLSEVE